MVVSSIGAATVQSAGGSVTFKNMSWKTPSGRTMSALLLIANDASVKDKRPTIVLAHGWWNNKEMQDSNYVELARRGYVVLSVDMCGHESSSDLQVGHEIDAATGMSDAVSLIQPAIGRQIENRNQWPLELSRKIYRETTNPYIGGFVMAAVATLIAASNTLTYLLSAIH